MEYLANEQISGINPFAGHRISPKTANIHGNLSSRFVPQTRFVSGPVTGGSPVIRQIHPILSLPRKPHLSCGDTLRQVTRKKAPKRGLTFEPLAVPPECSGFTRMPSPISSRLKTSGCCPIDRSLPQGVIFSPLCPAILSTAMVNTALAKPARSRTRNLSSLSILNPCSDKHCPIPMKPPRMSCPIRSIPPRKVRSWLT